MLQTTVISGFSGAGKTTYLLDCLKRTEGKRRAVLMNDIAETVSGADQVRSLLHPKEDAMLEMPNGCICCTLEEQFLALTQEIASQPLDHLFIEANATAEPFLIRRRLEQQGLAIQSMITVIDASRFFDDYLSHDDLRARRLVALMDDDRLVSEVMAEQIEHADTLIIRKEDKVAIKHSASVASLLRSLNSAATIAHTGKAVHRKSSLGVMRFKANRPFHPLRLHTLLHSDAFRGVLRGRGTAWIATHNDIRILWSQTGNVCTIEPDGTWWLDDQRDWFEAHGQRHQAIEFVGFHFDKPGVQKSLSACLLTDTEMALDSDLWRHFPDPLGVWDEENDRSLYFIKPEPFPAVSLPGKFATNANGLHL